MVKPSGCLTDTSWGSLLNSSGFMCISLFNFPSQCGASRAHSCILLCPFVLLTFSEIPSPSYYCHLDLHYILQRRNSQCFHDMSGTSELHCWIFFFFFNKTVFLKAPPRVFAFPNMGISLFWSFSNIPEAFEIFIYLGFENKTFLVFFFLFFLLWLFLLHSPLSLCPGSAFCQAHHISSLFLTLYFLVLEFPFSSFL